MKPTTTTLLAALLTLSVSRADAQTVLFEDGFEAGLVNWSVTSNDDGTVFHHVRSTNKCLGSVAPFPSGIDAAWAGDNDICSFSSSFWPKTEMTLLQPIDLPLGMGDIRLSFWSYDDVECDSCGWDWRFVYVSDDGGVNWTFLGESYRRFNWYQVSFDLTPWAGSSVLVRFDFDAVDGAGNEGLGWLVDDVRVVANACADPVNYCVAAPNSAGPGATMGWNGSTSIGADDFELTLSGGPPNQFAHFFYGPDEALVPVADGFLCIGPGATGFVRLVPPGKIDGAGSLSREIDYGMSYKTKGWLTTGSTWRFQAWYRDPKAGNTGSNFTDGLRVTFCP